MRLLKEEGLGCFFIPISLRTPADKVLESVKLYLFSMIHFTFHIPHVKKYIISEFLLCSH
jgi:hypothetical protein